MWQKEIYSASGMFGSILEPLVGTMLYGDVKLVSLDWQNSKKLYIATVESKHNIHTNVLRGELDNYFQGENIRYLIENDNDIVFRYIKDDNYYYMLCFVPYGDMWSTCGGTTVVKILRFSRAIPKYVRQYLERYFRNTVSYLNSIDHVSYVGMYTSVTGSSLNKFRNYIAKNYLGSTACTLNRDMIAYYIAPRFEYDKQLEYKYKNLYELNYMKEYFTGVSDTETDKVSESSAIMLDNMIPQLFFVKGSH